jgi:hypothetical protein
MARLAKGWNARNALKTAATAVFLLVAACGRSERPGPVRTAEDAARVAHDALSSANLDEEIISVDRSDGAWMVTTRWRQTSMAGHLVTVDAASGAVRMERYRMLQLGGAP